MYKCSSACVFQSFTELLQCHIRSAGSASSTPKGSHQVCQYVAIIPCHRLATCHRWRWLQANASGLSLVLITVKSTFKPPNCTRWMLKLGFVTPSQYSEQPQDSLVHWPCVHYTKRPICSRFFRGIWCQNSHSDFRSFEREMINLNASIGAGHL